MAASKTDIRGWFRIGVSKGCTHMIVMCDTFDYDDYPVYVERGQDAREEADKRKGNMQKVMECYNLSMDMEAQIAEHRAMHYEPAPEGEGHDVPT